MALEIIGKINSKLGIQNGVSARGNWSKQEFIVETQEQYPRKVCMNVWGADKVEELGRYNEGDVLKIAQKEATIILEEDKYLESMKYKKLKNKVEKIFLKSQDDLTLN